MKKLIMGILFVSLTTLVIAKDIDMTKSKGTEQSVILSLTPPAAYMDTDQDVVLTATFDVELDAKHVQKNNVKLKHITQTKESLVDGTVAYDTNDNAVIFTPSSLLTYGYYEVEFKSLKATKINKSQQIKEIKYRFYVPEVINGYKLPFAPDSTVNNATLLGVDSNDNGVRDDVEIYIIKRYAQDPKYPKTKTAIALQYAWASQKILESPTMESKKHIDDALDCQYYWADKERDKYTQGLSGFEKSKYYSKLKFLTDPILKDKVYNTRARISQKFSFNAALSGNIFDGRDESIENCRTNIDEIGE